MAENDIKRYENALDYAAEKHKNQYRIGGEPYITHPVGVSEILRQEGYNIDYRIAALFHDLLEDTDAREEEILILGNEEILEAVRLLTKREGYENEKYLYYIKKNPMALAVKSADRLHNLMTAGCADDKFKRKYILETIEWYIDFSPKIETAVKELALSLKEPMTELSFLYERAKTKDGENELRLFFVKDNRR